ncbi:hypothetical protein [Burkholderia ambifaria]|uniref:hypothetical protein n=1 Tax=Burkholderia ambifaria TaxID=152480 RepID=UPI0015887744|nr:hypothetical protein [Burkholderia ambifaria]
MSGWAAELIGDEPWCAFADAVNRVICASCEHEAQIRKGHDMSSHTVHVVRDYPTASAGQWHGSCCARTI